VTPGEDETSVDFLKFSVTPRENETFFHLLNGSTASGVDEMSVAYLKL